MNTLVTTTLHPQTAASASAVVVTVEQPQTTSKQGFNVVQQNQTPVVQLMTHLPQQAPQVIEDDNTPVKGKDKAPVVPFHGITSQYSYCTKI